MVESGPNHNHDHTTQVVVCKWPISVHLRYYFALDIGNGPLTLPSRFFYCLEVANKGGITLGLSPRNLGSQTPLMDLTCGP